jgi:hypothetical protein
MRVLRVAATIALLAGPAALLMGRAYAQQMPNINLMPEVNSKSTEEKEAEEQRDKAYKESLKKIPDAKGSSDPWGVVRSDAPKGTATKAPAAKTKTKTGNAN